MSKGITILSYGLSLFTLYRRAFVPAQKESIPDRATGHAKKGDFGPKKQSCDAPITKQESHIPDRCSYFTGLRPDNFLCLHVKLSRIL